MTGTESTPALEIRDVVAGYHDAPVLRGVSLTVPSNSVTALIGPNGAGKTTLLNVVSGLLSPQSGQILVDGRDVTSLAAHRRAELGLCHIPEGRGIFRRLTVRENLAMQVGRGDLGRAVDAAVEAFPQLGKRLGQEAGTLSGGEQQMLAMARGHVTAPRLVLVDEASLGLAPKLVDSVFRFLGQMVAAEGVSLLIVDQFVSRALAIADTAHVLRQGALVFSGKPGELSGSDVFGTYLGE